MSTRGVYTFRDEHQIVHIYKHSDNYPEGPHGGIAAIEKAKPFAWPLPRFEADEFAAAFVAAHKIPAVDMDSPAVSRGGFIRCFPAGVDNPWEFSSDAAYWYMVSQFEGALWVTVNAVNWASEDEAQHTCEPLFAGPLARAREYFDKQAA